MRNAGVSLTDQARAQNIKFFAERDRQRQQQPILMDAVDQLTSSIARQQPQQQAPPPAEDSTVSDRMEVQETGVNQGDKAMGDSDGAHESESMETPKVAKET